MQEWEDSVKMENANQEKCTLVVNGRETVNVEKYYEDKMEQKNKIRDKRKEASGTITKYQKQNMEMIMGIARRIYQGTKWLKRGKRSKERGRERERSAATRQDVDIPRVKRAKNRKRRRDNIHKMKVDGDGRVSREPGEGQVKEQGVNREITWIE